MVLPYNISTGRWMAYWLKLNVRVVDMVCQSADMYKI
jgi:hypothetical protein